MAREGDGDQARRDAGFRLHEVISALRRDVAGQLEETAGDLARLASRPPGSCPAHGLTLSQSGAESWCTELGCGRRWNWWRLTMPCTEAITHRVRFAAGETPDVCAGQAIEARLRVIGGTVTLLQQ